MSAAGVLMSSRAFALCGGAGVAHGVEEAVKEVDLVGEYVECEVGNVGRQRHPGTGQGMQSASDIEN